MDTLALTDRDGVYGAVKFVQACMSAGIRPVLGVDLALEPTAAPQALVRAEASAGPGRKRTSPAHGGAFVDPGHPRVTLLAQDKAGLGCVVPAGQRHPPAG